MNALAGVPVALAAAASFGASSILQYRATHRVPEERAGRPALLVSLVRQPMWRWSIILAVFGFGLQVLALKLMPLGLVQPLLVTGLLWYVLLAPVFAGRRPRRVLVLGALICLVGLSAFLALADPRPRADVHPLDSPWLILPLGVALATVLFGCLTLAAAVGPDWRSLPLALAAGICYGVTAALVRSLTPYFADGPVTVLGHWQSWALCLLGPFGVLLNQNSYQAGRLGAPALAVITVTDPLVSIVVGVFWLHERIRLSGPALLGDVLALCCLCAGILLLARQAPHLARPAGTLAPATGGTGRADAVARHGTSGPGTAARAAGDAPCG